jgi:amino acid transporter
MNEDILILLFCYLIFGLTLLFLTLKSENKQKIAVINLTVAGIYSAIFIYNLIYNSSGGSSLGWLMFLIFFIGVHWLIIIVRLIFKIIEKIKNKNKL